MHYASSGRISTIYAIPSWQQSISMSANQGSTTMQNLPDIALTADNIFLIADNGTPYSVGGTSCAAPLWAGFTALVNQQAAANGKTQVGLHYQLHRHQRTDHPPGQRRRHDQLRRFRRGDQRALALIPHPPRAVDDQHGALGDHTLPTTLIAGWPCTTWELSLRSCIRDNPCESVATCPIQRRRG